MFGLARIIQRIIENPKLLIAVVVLVPLAVVVDCAVLGSWDNPLPDGDDAVSISFVPDGGGGPRPVDAARYEALCECLDGAEPLRSPNADEMAGRPVGTLVVRLADGDEHRADLYAWGFVRTRHGLFEAGSGHGARDLASAIRQISR